MHASDLLLRLTPSDPLWTSFLDSYADINIFYHPAWMQLMAECYGYRPFVLALPDAARGLVAAVLLMEVNSPINGRRWVSLPFSDYCRPLSKDESTLKDFTDQLVRLVEGEKVPILELSGMYPAHLSMHSYSNYVVHAMHWRNVRIAMDNDVEVICGNTADHLAEFYHLHLLKRRRQGVPIQPWKFL
jgi:hypothetical protein